ncbi:MAG: helix-turn-helix transcriptional regulator [Oscillospiraceae bacterium]
MKEKDRKSEIGKAIGDNVRFMRLKRKLTLEELATISNIGVQTLKQIERGRTDCYVSTLVNIANALGTSTEYLVGNCSLDSPENLLYVFNLLSEEKRNFTENLIYQIKASPYEFYLLNSNTDNK